MCYLSRGWTYPSTVKVRLHGGGLLEKKLDMQQVWRSLLGATKGIQGLFACLFLGFGVKYLLSLPLLGRSSIIQFEEHVFQMGWFNHLLKFELVEDVLASNLPESSKLESLGIFWDFKLARGGSDQSLFLLKAWHWLSIGRAVNRLSFHDSEPLFFFYRWFFYIQFPEFVAGDRRAKWVFYSSKVILISTNLTGDIWSLPRFFWLSLYELWSYTLGCYLQ